MQKPKVWDGQTLSNKTAVMQQAPSAVRNSRSSQEGDMNRLLGSRGTAEAVQVTKPGLGMACDGFGTQEWEVSCVGTMSVIAALRESREKGRVQTWGVRLPVCQQRFDSC